MRVATYNMLNGGEGRADPLAEVLEAQRADVISLVEADVVATVERIAKRLSMDFVIAEGDGHSSALLSRFPIVQSINHAALNPTFSRSLLEATVMGPSEVEWTIGVLHLPAGAADEQESARMPHITRVLEVFEPHRKKQCPHLLCGDFNSNAPYQRIDPQKCKMKTRQAWEANSGRLPRQVIQSILDAGYFDTFSSVHDEQKEMIGSFDTQHPGQRVDYIFGFGFKTAQIKDAWVETDRLAKYASDHFPVGVEISETL